MNLKDPGAADHSSVEWDVGAADHSSVEWDVGFNLVLSTVVLCPSNYLVIVNNNFFLHFCAPSPLVFHQKSKHGGFPPLPPLCKPRPENVIGRQD